MVELLTEDIVYARSIYIGLFVEPRQVLCEKFDEVVIQLV